jgi:hypothetical protein
MTPVHQAYPAVGVLALLSFVVCGFLAAVPSQLADIDDSAPGKSA